MKRIGQIQAFRLTEGYPPEVVKLKKRIDLLRARLFDCNDDEVAITRCHLQHDIKRYKELTKLRSV